MATETTRSKIRFAVQGWITWKKTQPGTCGKLVRLTRLMITRNCKALTNTVRQKCQCPACTACFTIALLPGGQVFDCGNKTTEGVSEFRRRSRCRARSFDRRLSSRCALPSRQEIDRKVTAHIFNGNQAKVTASSTFKEEREAASARHSPSGIPTPGGGSEGSLMAYPFSGGRRAHFRPEVEVALPRD